MFVLNPLNQFSFLILAGLGLGGLLAVFYFTGFTRRKGLALGAAALALVVVWLSLRTGASPVQDAAQAELVIRSPRQPVLVEFYSDYCAGCLAAKPILDALERELKDELTVVRLDVASAAGRQLGGELDLRATPTFILFDRYGREIWRTVGELDAAEVRAALDKT